MGTSTYGISLQVCNSLAYKWDVKLNTRREILHLRATMYYFVYHMNTIALYWEEKPTSLMNENRWIGNPWITGIVECVGTKSLDGFMISHDYKNNNGCNFQFTKLSFNDFVLTDRRSLSGKWPKSASGKSSSFQFSFSAEKNANTKATEYITFGFSLGILVFFPF